MQRLHGRKNYNARKNAAARCRKKWIVKKMSGENPEQKMAGF
jgi:hypothetical protein